MVHGSFIQEVKGAFDTLLQEGQLVLESAISDSKAFGNSAVVLAGRHFKVRVTMDRGDVFAEARGADPTSNWVPLETMLEAVGLDHPPPVGLLSPARAAALVGQSLDLLEAGLAAAKRPHTLGKIAAIQKSARSHE